MNGFATKWAAALRSGEYQQGSGFLRKGDSYCCLGVACDLLQRELGVGAWSPSDEGDCFDFLISVEKQAFSLPYAVMEALGLADKYGCYGGDEYGQYDDTQSLAALNDSRRSFSEIADIIESEPEGLFV